MPSLPRDYRRLFTAMNEVLRVLATGGDEKDALQRSFADAAAGFSAEKAILLLVAEQQPLRLRELCSEGLTDKQIEACEQGSSVQGVSASLIKAVVAGRKARLVENPLLQVDTEMTPAFAGQSYSVLCAPILDYAREAVLAVLYFQTASIDPQLAYREEDLVWLEGYVSALGHGFALHFHEQRLERERRDLLQGVEPPDNAPDLVGSSAHVQALRRELHEALIPAADAQDPEPILILGERGTGKDLVARYIHAYSKRRDRPYVAVNCAEITDEMAAARFFGHKKGSFTGAISTELGLFRAADKGVLFLDEIGELSPRAQATLLRALENRAVAPVGEAREVKVDVLVLLATNRDPQKAVAEGLLREDLLDRFATHSLRLEPLRERAWDVPDLLRHFLQHHERRMRKRTLGFSSEAQRALVSYRWPGNVRELARVCALLVTHAKAGGWIDKALLERHYPVVLQSDPNPKAGPALLEDASMRAAVEAFERELVLSRLERHGWNLRGARESLGLPKTTFRRLLIALGIEVKGDAGGEDADA